MLKTLSTQKCTHLAINEACSEGKDYKNSSFMPFLKVCVDKLEKWLLHRRAICHKRWTCKYGVSK